MSAIVDELIKLSVSRKRLRSMITQETARVRRSAPEAATYGLAGAVTAPAIHRVHTLIEHKGRLPTPTQFYRAGRFKIPTKLPALAASGFLFAGVLPYFQDLVRARRQHRTALKMQKQSQHISSIIFKAPHLRGTTLARVAEKSKAMATRKLRHIISVAKLHPGEYRT